MKPALRAVFAASPRSQPGARVVLFSGWLLLTACATPDPYQRPEPPAKTGWSLNGAAPAAAAAAAIRPDWWVEFGDPTLDRLVRRAVADNLDIKILAARVDAAAVYVEREQAANRPKLGVSSSASVTRNAAGSAQSYAANLTGLSWELDLWGKVRRGVLAQQAELDASEADYRAGYLSLVADVADGYFQLRQLDRQLDQQRRAVSQGERILQIFQNRQREGVVAASKVVQQRAELRNLRQNQLDLERRRTLAENRLATLLGVAAGEFRLPAEQLTAEPRAPLVPAGLPAQLLSRRPDILAAEYRVLKAHELVGQARLAKLPSVTLTGSGGLASALLSGLLSGWSLGLGAAVNIPIFDPGLDLQIESNQIGHRIAEENYRKTVIKAFEEVENALINLASRRAQRRELAQRVADLEIVNATVAARLREGMVSQLELFESQRSLLAARQTLQEIDHQILQDTVTLYKALGGGWPTAAAPG